MLPPFIDPISRNILWQPSEKLIADANITRFAKLNGFAGAPYETLHRWSIGRPEEFWSALWDFVGVKGEKGSIALERQPGKTMLGAKWFPEASLNFAENLLQGPDDALAIIEANEDGIVRRVTMGQLRQRVSQAQQALRKLGVTRGDRVGAILPNNLDALVALLATASLGAIWSSCSPDFGAAGIIDRIGQIQPKVVIAATSYRYNNKLFEVSDRLNTVIKGMAGVEHLVLTTPSTAYKNDSNASVHSWEDICNVPAQPLSFEQCPFNHPLYIMYTSGTTGLPKGIVHSAGGTLLQHYKEHVLHGDVKPGDTLSWYTNTAWMMYHWVISGLAAGAAILLYDGAAMVKRDDRLDMGILWKIAEEAGVTHFGINPKYLSTLMESNYIVGQRHDMSRLRSVLSAGAPVSPEQYDWVYSSIKSDMIFASISGGTEIIGCFVLGSPIHPVRRGEITCKGLGMAVDVFDDRNASVIGVKGDLVCTQPFPSAPLTFWGENGDQRYRDTYFSQREDTWTHGDLAEQTINGTVIIYGRTDTTLKPGGVRIGTAEIYRVVESYPWVQDSIVFGHAVPGDEEIVLCLVMKEGQELTADRIGALRAAIREQASPRHVPHHITAVRGIPYTLSGKKVEGAVRSVVSGKEIKNLGSIANPDCLEDFANLFAEAA
ncbi:acetoacetate--CoA ligase [Noviherbaspirillum sedimenti]|uniref:Acetoacetate--CoA ligase n=1 Tax=Noviherbaspirillum sedimenti TaxID=2320865 RepID=A0A3A3G2A6_9BURK|nr:acetoacetate--CoA ligase [Noviherbaspirillum sedimenti]RJG02603.1 acetoacetate--CoA ligase [Noviherbaspirillum sedimenti]